MEIETSVASKPIPFPLNLRNSVETLYEEDLLLEGLHHFMTLVNSSHLPHICQIREILALALNPSECVQFRPGADKILPEFDLIRREALRLLTCLYTINSPLEIASKFPSYSPHPILSPDQVISTEPTTSTGSKKKKLKIVVDPNLEIDEMDCFTVLAGKRIGKDCPDLWCYLNGKGLKSKVFARESMGRIKKPPILETAWEILDCFVSLFEQEAKLHKLSISPSLLRQFPPKNAGERHISQQVFDIIMYPYNATVTGSITSTLTIEEKLEISNRLMALVGKLVAAGYLDIQHSPRETLQQLSTFSLTSTTIFLDRLAISSPIFALHLSQLYLKSNSHQTVQAPIAAGSTSPAKNLRSLGKTTCSQDILTVNSIPCLKVIKSLEMLELLRKVPLTIPMLRIESKLILSNNLKEFQSVKEIRISWEMSKLMKSCLITAFLEIHQVKESWIQKVKEINEGLESGLWANVETILVAVEKEQVSSGDVEGSSP